MADVTFREAEWLAETAQAAGEAEKANRYFRMSKALREIDRAAAELHRAQARLTAIQNEVSA